MKGSRTHVGGEQVQVLGQAEKGSAGKHCWRKELPSMDEQRGGRASKKSDIAKSPLWGEVTNNEKARNREGQAQFISGGGGTRKSFETKRD